MAKEFLSDDFLLQSNAASTLYHEYAKVMPIYDYHCHLPVADIANNTQFDNISQVWLYGDHY
ncbi:MAG: glucuronate isomerase, partial [Planctomycetes bacterium]|nr:glucuronate isomerase [Planctomycetota bacterium]